MSATESASAYPTEFVECDRCYGDGEYEDDLWILVRCFRCGGRGTVEVCAACYDSGEEECDACGC
jgi:hypothetical protein